MLAKARADNTSGAVRRLSVAVAMLGALALFATNGASGSHTGADQPNIVVLQTDDQSTHEMFAMRRTRALLAARGVEFTRYYASYPLCCPSRASLYTGRYMHNHLVRGNGGRQGGWAQFNGTGDEANSLPVWLDAAGYRTGHVGKYLNGYGVHERNVPPGWDEWYTRLNGIGADDEPFENNNFNDYTMLEDSDSGDSLAPREVDYGFGESDYQTDVYRDKAVGFIRDNGNGSGGEPFFLDVEFGAPHWPFQPAPRHKFAFAGRRLPRLPAFNEKDMTDKPHFLRRAASGRFSAQTRSLLTRQRRRRLEMLLAVDEAVQAIVDALEAEGELDETYILFTSDQGYFRGEHRIGSSKFLPYEAVTRVPFFIRGPGIPAGRATSEMVANIDIAPTIAELTHVTPGRPMDGRSLIPFARSPGLRTTRPILLEADTGSRARPNRFALRRPGLRRLRLHRVRGASDLEQEPGAPPTILGRRGARRAVANGNIAPPYRGIRTARYSYVIYSTGSSELYDMYRDPGQLRSVHRVRRYRRVRRWLYRHLVDLSFCRASDCRLSIGNPPKPLRRKRRERRR